MKATNCCLAVLVESTQNTPNSLEQLETLEPLEELEDPERCRQFELKFELNEEEETLEVPNFQPNCRRIRNPLPRTLETRCRARLKPASPEVRRSLIDAQTPDSGLVA